MESLRFRDFQKLKSGKDQYSNLGLKDLKSIIQDKDLSFLFMEFQKEKIVLRVLRWMHRGLKFDRAVRKVKTDLEIEKFAKRIHLDKNRAYHEI